MSTEEQIFFRTDLEPAGLAALLAQVTGFTLVPGDPPLVYGQDIGGVAGRSGGAVERNDYSEPEPRADDDRTVFDDFPVLWEIITRGDPAGDQELAARTAFDVVVATVGLPVLLVHDLQTLRAAWDPDHGLREFAPGTSVDADDEAVWTA
jgi:hypothetical protein